MKSKEEIIKCLNACINDNCNACEYYSLNPDCKRLLKDVLALIEQNGEENNADNVWNLVREIFKRDARDLDEIFGHCSPGSVINNLSYNEAKEKFEKWTEQRTFDVGDEVKWTESDKMIIFSVDGHLVYGIHCDTKALICIYKEDAIKTGTHIDLTDLFKQMGE